MPAKNVANLLFHFYCGNINLNIILFIFFVSTIQQGVIKFFKADKGFGFIEREGDTDLFFHISDSNLSEDPQKGQPVKFEVGDGKKGPVAKNIQFG